MEDEEGDFATYSLYEEIVSEVLAGRTEGHKCPVCVEGELDCSADDMHVMLKCKKCGRFFEGMLA